MRLVQDILLEHLHSLLSGGSGSSEVKPSFFCSVQSCACRFPCVSSVQRCCHHRVPNKTPRSLARIILWISWPSDQLCLVAVYGQTGAQPATGTADLDTPRYRPPGSTWLAEPKLSLCFSRLSSLTNVCAALVISFPFCSGSSLLDTLHLVHCHSYQDPKAWRP